MRARRLSGTTADSGLSKAQERIQSVLRLVRARGPATSKIPAHREYEKELTSIKKGTDERQLDALP